LPDEIVDPATLVWPWTLYRIVVRKKYPGDPEDEEGGSTTA
jgi:hypothetical protein